MKKILSFLMVVIFMCGCGNNNTKALILKAKTNIMTMQTDISAYQLAVGDLDDLSKMTNVPLSIISKNSAEILIQNKKCIKFTLNKNFTFEQGSDANNEICKSILKDKEIKNLLNNNPHEMSEEWFK